MGTRHGYREMENWEQSKELEMKLLIGLGFKSDFVPIFHFLVPRSPFPVLVTCDSSEHPSYKETKKKKKNESQKSRR